MSNENVTEPEPQQGIFIRGEYLGIEESRTWTPRDEPGATRTVRPKLGLRVNGEEVAIVAKDEPAIAQTRAGWVKGDLVEVAVEPLPPFGARGSVVYTLPGTYERNRAGNWK